MNNQNLIDLENIFLDSFHYEKIYYLNTVKWIFIFKIQFQKDCCYIYIYDKQRSQLYYDEYFFEKNNFVLFGITTFLRSLIKKNQSNEISFEEDRVITNCLIIYWNQFGHKNVVLEISLKPLKNSRLHDLFYKYCVKIQQMQNPNEQDINPNINTIQ
jgi:hypothetical protein